ncbi:unnamed protein product, partial [Closterium sp. NIES-54]
DHFLSLEPTSLTVDLLEQHLLAPETSAVAVGAARGTPHPPLFEGCSPFPLAPSYASPAAADVSVAEDIAAASTSAKHRSSKGKGGRGGGGGSGGGGGGSGSGGGGSSGGGGGGGTGGASGGSGGGGGGSGGSGGSGRGGTGGGRIGPRRGGLGGGQRQQQQRRSETQSPQQLREWLFQRGSGVAIFDLDYDVILSAMYALCASAEGDCYRCVPPDPGRAAAALGASESGTLPGTEPAEALNTFTLDSGASRCFFRDNTTLTPLPAPVPVRLADPSQGSVVARSSTVLPCPAVPSGSLSGLHLPSFSTNLVSTAALQDAMVTTTTPGGQRVSICMCTQTGCHLATFTHRPGSSLYTLATEPPQVAAYAQVSASGQVAASCYCRLLSHQTLLWHHRLGHPSLPRLRGMHSRLLVSGLPREKALRQNGIAERCIGLVMEVVFSSMIHAAAPHFLWLFAVRYAAHQLNLWPRVSVPETSPTLRWTREVGDASVFRVWGSRAFVRDTSADKLLVRAIPCVFLGFVLDAPGCQFYHLTLRRVLPSQDVTFDKSIPFYGLFPYRSAPPSPPRLFLALGLPPVDPLPPQGPAPSGVSQVDPLPRTARVEVAFGSGASRGAASGGAEPGGAESEGAGSGGGEPGGEELGGAKTAGVEPGGAEPEGVEPGGAESEGAESGGAEPRGAALSGGHAGASQRLSSQQLREWLVWCARLLSGATGAGGAGDAQDGGAGVTVGAGGTGGNHTKGAGAAETGGAGGAGAGGARFGGTGALTVSRLLAAAVTNPFFDSAAAPAHVAEFIDFAAACCLDYVTALVAESASASPPSVGGECALGTDVLEDRQEDFECLAATVPRFASMLLAPEGDPDAPDIPTPRSYAEAITGPYSSQWQAAMDDEMASWKSTGTYVNKVPPPGANIVNGMWIFRVKRPPGSPPAFKARYIAQGFSQQQGVDYFHTFSPTLKMTILWVLLHVAA